MKDVKLYRRRLIPEETIYLKDDVILLRNEDCIVTKWHTLKPKPTMSYGYSCYFPKKGWKISKFCRKDGSLYCWYCDIIKTQITHTGSETTYLFTDLLADVILYEDNIPKIVDLDEIADALEQNLLSKEDTVLCMRQLNSLLAAIYEQNFQELARYLIDLT